MDKFFAAQAKKKLQQNEAPNDKPTDEELTSKQRPRGVVLGKDGKPCRTCTSSADWAAMMKTSLSTSSQKASTISSSSSTSTAPKNLPTDCPPDVDTLGSELPSIYPPFPKALKAYVQTPPLTPPPF